MYIYRGGRGYLMRLSEKVKISRLVSAASGSGLIAQNELINESSKSDFNTESSAYCLLLLFRRLS